MNVCVIVSLHMASIVVVSRNVGWFVYTCYTYIVLCCSIFAASKLTDEML